MAQSLKGCLKYSRLENLTQSNDLLSTVRDYYPSVSERGIVACSVKDDTGFKISKDTL